MRLSRRTCTRDFSWATSYVPRELQQGHGASNDLSRALYFGVSVVQSQGIETGDVMYQIRADQHAGKLPGREVARCRPRHRRAERRTGRRHICGNGVRDHHRSRGAQGRPGARRQAKWTSSRSGWTTRNGRAPELSPALIERVIDEAHRRGLRVNAHVFYHDDAVDLWTPASTAFAHLVRDNVMDDALIAAIVKRGVYVKGNMSSPRQSTYVGPCRRG